MASPALRASQFVAATSIADAVAALADAGPEGQALAGGTWIMRAPIRQEQARAAYVGIASISKLRTIETSSTEIRIGAAVTHAQLVSALEPFQQCRGLVTAARGAANPSIRNVATVGGNLCAVDFAASDLAPALLALDADVELAGPGGMRSLALSEFLEVRRSLSAGTLVTGVRVSRRPVRTAHVRLPLRKAGDYPVAILSIAVETGTDEAITDVRIALGSIEPVARRWASVERAMSGRRLQPSGAAEIALGHLGDLAAREGVEAPGWYRKQVLPALLRRAVASLGLA